MIALWFHPGSSAGWPLEMGELTYEERTKFEQNYIDGGLYLLKKYPVKILGKGVIFTTTLFVQLAGFIGLYFLLKSEKKVLGIAILSYFLIRTIHFGFTNYVESRHMSQLTPLLQFLTAYFLITAWRKFQPAK